MHVCLILFPGFPMLGYVLLQEVLRIANACVGQPLFSCRIRTVTGAPVTASDGTVIEADAQDWEGAQGFDLMVLCAGDAPLRHLPMGLRGFLHRAETAGATLAGLDHGALILARLGLLDGREAVLPPDPDRSYPRVSPSARNHVFDRQRLTSSGGLATAEALLDWIARAHSPALANQTGIALAHGRITENSRLQQLADAADPVMARMQSIMATHLEAPLPLPRIADELDLSLKQLRARCRKALGMKPLQVYLQLRLNRAAQLIEDTELSISDISAATGFASPSAFSRSFRSHFGHPPRSKRQSPLIAPTKETAPAESHSDWNKAAEAARPTAPASAPPDPDALTA